MTPSQLCLLTLLTLPLAAPLAHASDTSSNDATRQQDASAAPSLKFLSASVDGALCPRGSGHASISDDGEALTLTFSSVEVSSESGDKSDGKCRVRLELDVSEGYAFSGLAVATSGYYYAPGSGRANMKVGYSFPANWAGQSFPHKKLTGDRDYVFHDEANEAWSPCGGSSSEPVVLYVDLNLATSGEAYISASSIDADVRLGSELQWRTCD